MNPRIISTEPTWVDRLAERAATTVHPQLSFINDDDSVNSLSFAGIDRQARRIATRLHGATGARALLLFPAGLDFVTAFFGCLYGGVVAVPAHPPHPARLQRTLPRLLGIVADAEVRYVLTTRAILQAAHLVCQVAPALADLEWIATDALEGGEDDWKRPNIAADDPAFLQYTSGSTATPKGVVVTHRNLLGNGRMLEDVYRRHERVLQGDAREIRSVSWLPQYHDMGLIWGVLQPIYSGFSALLMSPLYFLQKPHRWLEAVTRVRATWTIAPNFAYDLAVSAITPAERRGLDLSALVIAHNGAEPIRADTLDRFATAYEPCGLRRSALCPCYGLAEATLVVSSAVGKANVKETGHGLLTGDRRAEPKHPWVSSGRPASGLDVLIVNTDTMEVCPDECVGEIWVAGESVALGYWGNPDLSKTIFQATTADGRGPFLRTGDLGFMFEGELYVTGRIKDLIVIRGVNHYPQDLEQTAEQSHRALRQGCSAAFPVVQDGEEHVVVVAEAKTEYEEGHQATLEEALASVRESILDEHGLQPSAIVLIRSRTIAKTSSGKIQRHASRAEYLSGGLAVVARWEHRPQLANTSQSQPRPAMRLSDSIRNWLVARLARTLEVPWSQIDTSASFARLGLDSARSVALAGELQEWLGRPVPPTLLWEHVNIEAIATHLGYRRSTETRPRERVAPTHRQPIAVVGIGCRLPGASNPRAYWDLLTNGRDLVGEIPPARWQKYPVVEAVGDLARLHTLRRGGFVDEIAGFDPEFFGITEHEARRIDPQHRLLLEVTWNALNDAGQPPAGLAGSAAGVFVGISTAEYAQALLSSPQHADAYLPTGVAQSLAANRISHLLQVRGPSLAIDTACSSSLVAIQLACESIWRGESSLALAGGVNLIVAPWISLSLERAGFLAPDACKAFDSRANGYVRGEGAAMVVLKPLAQARADGDRIYALVLGGATNHAGQSNGLTAPSAQAQFQLLRQAYRTSGVDPGQISYVEAHGTGTLLGDPIEAQALGAALASATRTQPCAIGSVKTNIGHLEAAAGVAGFIKVALALHEKKIPPSLHFENPNPNIPFAELPLRVQTELGEWPSDQALAGVSSFGFGGANAHVVLARDVDPPRARLGANARRLLVLSAHSTAALEDRAKQVLALAETADSTDSAWREDLAAGSVRGDHHPFRAAVVHGNAGELIDGLRHVVPKRAAAFNGPRHVVFVVLNRLGVPHEDCLAQLDSSARHAWQRCEEEHAAHFATPLVARNERGEEPPSSVALQIALATQWQRLGLIPSAVIGHGAGEIAAAYIAGRVNLSDSMMSAGAPNQRPATEPPTVALYTDLQPVDSGRAGSALRLGSVEQAIAQATELGPAAFVLLGHDEPLRQRLESVIGRKSILVLPTVRPGEPLQRSMLRGVGALYEHGFNPDWSGIYPKSLPWAPLPSYPWQRRAYWFDDDPPNAFREDGALPSPVRSSGGDARRSGRITLQPSKFITRLTTEPEPERAQSIAALLISHLGASIADIKNEAAHGRPLREGLDSLGAAELRHRLLPQGIDVPAAFLLGGISFRDLVSGILDQVAAMKRGEQAVDGGSERDELTYSLATSPEDLEAVNQLRRSVYATKLGLSGVWSGEKQRDLASHVFVARLDHKVVASWRAIPISSGLSELASWGQLSPEMLADPHLCELGRLVADFTDPRGLAAGTKLMRWAAERLLANTPLHRYVAFCQQGLVRLYRQFGGEVRAGTFQIPARGQQPYFFISGDMQTGAKILKRLA